VNWRLRRKRRTKIRCSCCDRILSDAEATAKFVEPDGSKPTRFVEMCTKCQGYLPPSVRVVTRSDLEETGKDVDFFFDYGESYGDED
jgi:hypothetical protein